MALVSVMDDKMKPVLAMEFNVYLKRFSRPSYFQPLELADEEESHSNVSPPTAEGPLELAYEWSGEDEEDKYEYEGEEADESGKYGVSAEEETDRIPVCYVDLPKLPRSIKIICHALNLPTKLKDSWLYDDSIRSFKSLTPFEQLRTTVEDYQDWVDEALLMKKLELAFDDLLMKQSTDAYNFQNDSAFEQGTFAGWKPTKEFERVMSPYNDTIHSDLKPAHTRKCNFKDEIWRLQPIRPIRQLGVGVKFDTMQRFLMGSIASVTDNLIKNHREKDNKMLQLSIFDNLIQDKGLHQDSFAYEGKRAKFMRWRIQFLEENIRKHYLRPDGNCTMVQVNDMKNSPGLAFLHDNYLESVAKQDRFLQQFIHYKNEDLDLEKQSGSRFGQGMHGKKVSKMSGLLNSFLKCFNLFPGKETERNKRTDNEAWQTCLDPSPPQPTGGFIFQETTAHSLLLMATMLASVSLVGAVNPGIITGNSGFGLLVWLNSVVFFTSIATIVFLMHKLPVMPWLLIATSSAIGVYMCAIQANSPQEVVPVIFIGCFIFVAAFSQFQAWQRKEGNYMQWIRSTFLRISII